MKTAPVRFFLMMLGFVLSLNSLLQGQQVPPAVLALDHHGRRELFSVQPSPTAEPRS